VPLRALLYLGYRFLFNFQAKDAVIEQLMKNKEQKDLED